MNQEAGPMWDEIEREVVMKIRIFKKLWQLDAPLNGIIRRDLVIPAMAKLADFCACAVEEPGSETQAKSSQV